MKNFKKIVSIMVMAAMLSAIPGVGMLGGMVAWAAEITTVDEVVYEVVDETVYAIDAVEDVVYDIVEDVVYDTVEDVVYDTVEDVVYDTVEDAVYDTVEGHVYYTGISADIFALVIDEKSASVFGEIKENDVEPIIRNDRTMLPARFVAENLGAEVEWDAENRVVTVKSADVEIKLTIDSAVATVNGVEETLDSPAFIENDRTYTPVRFIAEKLGATVEWDHDLKMVKIAKAVAEEDVEAPAEEDAEAPADEEVEAPAEEDAEAPVEEEVEAPAEDAEVPAEETTEE
jgi:hypothetical protein